MDQAAQLQQFWAVVLNGTPKYCSPYNTIPILDPTVAGDYLFLQEITAILPIPFMVVGILTNLVFLLAVLRATNIRNAVNIYLGNLAVVDIIFLTTIAGVYIDRKYTKPAIYHETLFGCYFMSAAEAVVFYATICLITLALIHHLCVKPSEGFAKVAAVGNIATWIVALVFGCLAAIQYGKVWRLCFVWPKFPAVFQYLPNGYDKCAPGPIQDKHYAFYLELIKTATFFVGFLANIILYVLVCRKKSSEDSNPDMTNQVSRLLVVNGIVIFLCHTINRVLNIFNAMTIFFGKPALDQETTAFLTLTGNGLVYLNSSIRPVIHAVCSRAYRGGYWTGLTGHSIEVEDSAVKDAKDTNK
ncbi:uncharacterized protein [Amphiura filiformis]|uniref:uncharacterized protein n=1 Tax=Amphiura filiformis TaxID=82378 RepID=UPI003B21247C